MTDRILHDSKLATQSTGYSKVASNQTCAPANHTVPAQCKQAGLNKTAPDELSGKSSNLCLMRHKQYQVANLPWTLLHKLMAVMNVC